MRIGLVPLGASLQTREVGHAVLVHQRGEPEARAVTFAASLAADIQHTLAVVDLPPGALEVQCDAVARALPGHGSVRLTFVRPIPSREVRAAAQRMADLLRRTIVVPDGEPVPTAGGGLFIPAEHGTGWIAFWPGRGPRHESQRFPKPSWEFSTFGRAWQTSEQVIVEPLPSGVWVRGAGRAKVIEGRTWLMRQLPCHPEVMTVVLGSPGGPTVSLADVARFWETVLPTVRSRVRFMHYGPISGPDGYAYGQEIADRLGQQIVVYAGMPLEAATGSRPATVVSLHKHGTPDSRPFVSELMYFPRTGQRPASPPSLFGLRQPIVGVPEITAGVYEYSSDAVLEVVQSGLWMRPPMEPADADDVRCLPAGPGRFAIYYDRSTPSTAERMRSLAEDVLWRLDPATRQTFQLAPADEPWPVLLYEENDTWPLTAEPSEEQEDQRTVTQTPGRAGAVLPSESEEPRRARTSAGSGELVGHLEVGRRSRELRARSRRPATESVPQEADAAPQGAVAPPRRRTESAATTGGTSDAPIAHAGIETPLPAGVPGAGRHVVSTPLPAETGESTRPAPSRFLPDADGRPPVPVASWTRDPDSQGAPRTDFPSGHRADPGPSGGANGPSGAGSPPETAPTPPAPPEPGDPNPVDVLGPHAVSAPVPGPSGPQTVMPVGPAPFLPDPEIPGAAAPLPPASATLVPHAVPGVSVSVSVAAVPGADEMSAPVSAAPRIQLESAAPPEPPAEGAAPSGRTGAPPVQDRPASPEGSTPVVPAPAPVRQTDSDAVTPVAPADSPSRRPGVQVQPVPKAAACAAPGDRDIAKERAWVRRTFSAQYHSVSGSVSRIMSETPGLRGSRAEAGDALTDLVAVKLYLSGDSGQVDRAVRSATVGPHVPLARCVAAGLLRLPSYRGPSLVRVPASAAQRGWYREGRLVTEWGFCVARTDVETAGPGNTDFLIWSMTARRTKLLDPDRPDQVVFMPGTSFKVLRVEEEGKRPTVLMRELLQSEIRDDGQVDVARVPLDEIALGGLEQALEVIAVVKESDTAEQPVPGSGWPPGLISAHTAASPAPDKSVKNEGATP